tara:strand:+ start:536 stop:1108 length:573 start_codon:yes stop_codon:yes gene_type:complete
MMLSKIEDILTRLLSLFIILIISPILVIVYLLIIHFDGPPAVYKSKRMGFLNKEFIFYKFRTMTNNKDMSKRVITKLGRFLRRSSIDELPQLFNIMFGSMNFVGPRPLPIESYNTEQMKKYKLLRLSIKPGLTGLSQINTLGKPRAVDDKLKYDIKYIKRRNILLDIFILIKTISILFRRFKVNTTGRTL